MAAPTVGEVDETRRDTDSRLSVERTRTDERLAATEGGELAQKAAEAAEAAGAQGKFWEMHDRMFESRGFLNEFRLARYAASVGLDVRRFQREIVSQAIRAGSGPSLREGPERSPRNTGPLHQLGPVSQLVRPDPGDSP